MSGRDPGEVRREDRSGRRKAFAPRSGPNRPAWVAAGIGLVLTIAAAYAVARWERRTAWIAFEGVAATQLIELSNREAVGDRSIVGPKKLSMGVRPAFQPAFASAQIIAREICTVWWRIAPWSGRSDGMMKSGEPDPL